MGKTIRIDKYVENHEDIVMIMKQVMSECMDVAKEKNIAPEIFAGLCLFPVLHFLACFAKEGSQEKVEAIITNTMDRLMKSYFKAHQVGTKIIKGEKDAKENWV